MSAAPTQTPTPPPAIRLRSDLKAFVRTDGRAVIEDPVAGRHFRLGGMEYKYVVHLAHSGSASIAHSEVAKVDKAWTQDSSQQLLSWLANRGLLDRAITPSPDNPVDRNQARQPVDPLFYRLSLGSPEAWTSSIAKSIRPFLRPGSMWISTLLVVVAVIGFIVQWSQFAAAYEHLLSQRGALTLAICGLTLKVLHELGHCIACHHSGGRVREWGVLLICGAPLPFVDASDSRRFPSRRARITVALAGVATETLAVATSVLCASILDSPAAYYVASHLVLTLGVSALVFNLNPLMKFDGYYVLADCCGIDNLYNRGAEFTRRLVARLFLGRRAAKSPHAPMVVQIYGLASFGWRMLAMVTIGCVVIEALHGLGLLLVGWSVWRIWGRAVFQYLKTFVVRFKESSEVQPTSLDVLRPTALISLLLGCACCLPVPFESTTFATVEYDPPSIIRSPKDAFVEAVHVTENDLIEPGQLLLTLRNDDIADRLAKLELACLRHEQRIRSAHSQQSMQELKSAQFDLEAATELRSQAAAEVASLLVRSPVAGVVTARNLDQLVGTYLREGSEIAAVGREDAKRLRALPDSELSELFYESQSVRFLTPTGHSGEASVTRVLPRATRYAEDSSLGTQFGGPLEVKIDDSGKSEFAESHTPVLISLEPQHSLAASVGQRVAVAIGARITVAEWLYQLIWSRG